jgi:hypothetical protein
MGTKVLKAPAASICRVNGSYLKLEVACPFKKLVITHCHKLKDHKPKLLVNIPIWQTQREEPFSKGSWQ